MEIITTHINADFDCLGSMIAAKKLYPEAELVFSGSQERTLREFFLKSSSYSYGFKRIKEIDFAAVTRLILVDVSQADRIGPFASLARRDDVELHIYDHHPSANSDLLGTVQHIEPVGATVTLLSRLLAERGLHPTPDEATMMMLGLYEDTGSLQFNSTTVQDYHAAAYLLEHGASLNVVADFLTQELSAAQVALLHQLLENFRKVLINGVEIGLAHATTEQFVGDLAVLAHKLKDMENLDVLIVMVRMNDRIFMVGRSRIPEVHVGELLEEFNGGGHAFAASATLRELTLVQLLDELPGVLGRHVNPRVEARQLMSVPVRSVQSKFSISRVRDEMTRYHINSMPVLEGETVTGIITRQTVDRALQHELGTQPVADFMNKEISIVTPEANSQQLQELLVEKQQRFVPVVEQGLLVGALTRTDLLRHLISLGVARGFRTRSDLPENGLWLKKRRMAKYMEERLPTRVRELFRQFSQIAERSSERVFVVGGFVRDLLLRKDNLDIDLVVEGDGIAFARAFANQHQCRVRPHKKFGTAVVIFPDGFKVDIASARTEFYRQPAALPTVEHASVKMDLFRRDFTINTLAIALNQTQYGELVDFFGGQRDLKDKAIRVLHNLSFVEDPTRVFRAVRFEQRLGFHIGKPTEHLLRNAVRLGFVAKVGGYRLFHEIELILKEPDPWPAIERLAGLNLLQYIHPEIEIDRELPELFREAAKAISWHELLFTREPSSSWKVYLLCLVSQLNQPALEQLCQRLAVPPALVSLLCCDREKLLAAYSFLQRSQRRGGKMPASELYAQLKPLATEMLLYLVAQCSSATMRKWISQYVTRYQYVAVALNGTDLQNLGIPPGPNYKEIFLTLLHAKLDGRITTRDDELALVKKRFVKH
ncbi:MAG TPA: CBS domain-containing protein [Geothermobacteraceae bacterium]|nr:CBS domain-containing protein [Geothermobacteraceae bacterium]